MSCCARCGAVFACGMADGIKNEPCWCTQLPPLAPEARDKLCDGKAVTGCFCPACLTSATRNNTSLPG